MATESDLKKIYQARLRDRKQLRKKGMRIDERPLPLGDLLKNYFRGDREASRRMAESQALQAWPRYVGAAAAKISQAEKIYGGRLLIRVRDPLWRQQLIMLKNRLLSRFQRDFPGLKLKDIFFTGGAEEGDGGGTG